MSLSGLKPLPASLAIAAFVALMTWIANSIHLPFVLFPELGALGLVIFSDPRHPWARSPVLLMLTPFLTGVLGLMLTREMDYGLVAVLLNVAGSLLLISGLARSLRRRTAGGECLSPGRADPGETSGSCARRILPSRAGHPGSLTSDEADLSPRTGTGLAAIRDTPAAVVLSAIHHHR